MLPTPLYTGLERLFPTVYSPAEDTHALLDALELDQHRLRAAKPLLCLEIGSGSGVVSAFLAAIIGSNNAVCLATDINREAARATRRTGELNKVAIDVIITSLHTSLLPRLRGTVDVLVFNPPYVPTSAEEQTAATAQSELAGAWAGGADGMAVTSMLLPHVATLLSPKGCFYLVAIHENKPDELIERMQRDYGLTGEAVLQRRAGRELLTILRFVKSC